MATGTPEPAVAGADGSSGAARVGHRSAALITQGLTNAEIAVRLRIARRTAAHVEHIRNKLGVHSRAQIAVWAHAQQPKA